MGYWGKIIGGTAGFFVGGPYGAVIGAALGHAADSGSVESMRRPFIQATPSNPARVAGMLGRREEVFAITVTVLAAKLAKCDGPVTRVEIDAFKRNFRIPRPRRRGIGRLFDQARDSSDWFEPYAAQLGGGVRRQSRHAGAGADLAVQHRPRRGAAERARAGVSAPGAPAAAGWIRWPGIGAFGAAPRAADAGR